MQLQNSQEKRGRFFRREGGYEFPAVHTENSVTRRFKGLEKTMEPMVCEFTTDPAMLMQYAMLSQHMSNPRWGMGMVQADDLVSEEGEIMVARSGKLCLAGMRLRLSTPQNPSVFSFENEEYKVSEKLPELTLGARVYAEFSGFAALPDFQNKSMQREMLRRLFIRAASMGADFGFAASPLPQARSFCRIGELLGLKCSLRTHMSLPEQAGFEETMLYLTEFDLTPLRAIMTGRKTQAKNLESLS